SPITKLPPAEVPKIRIVVVASAVLPPSSTMWILIVKKPNDVYVWLPLTVYGPLPLPATVPLVAAVASPQSIVAVKSAVVANGLASVNVATAPLKAGPLNRLIPLALSGASATVAVECVTALFGAKSTSTIVTVTG